MQNKYGKEQFGFLSDSYTIPKEKGALVERMESEPGSFWIVKPPGKNNGDGIFVIENRELSLAWVKNKNRSVSG